MSLTSAFGLLALVLASVGIYGVMAYSVAQRTTEIGIRMALGAIPRQILAMVLREASSLSAAGPRIIPASWSNSPPNTAFPRSTCKRPTTSIPAGFARSKWLA